MLLVSLARSHCQSTNIAAFFSIIQVPEWSYAGVPAVIIHILIIFKTFYLLSGILIMSHHQIEHSPPFLFHPLLIRLLPSFPLFPVLIIITFVIITIITTTPLTPHHPLNLQQILLPPAISLHPQQDGIAPRHAQDGHIDAARLERMHKGAEAAGGGFVVSAAGLHVCEGSKVHELAAVVDEFVFIGF